MPDDAAPPCRRRPRIRPKPPAGQSEAGYQPTPDKLAAAVMLRRPKRVLH